MDVSETVDVLFSAVTVISSIPPYLLHFLHLLHQQRYPESNKVEPRKVYKIDLIFMFYSKLPYS